MRFFLTTIFIGTLALHHANAQHGGSKILKCAPSGSAILATAEDKYLAGIYNLEAPEIEDEDDMEALREIKELVAAKYPRKNIHSAKRTTSSVPGPVVLTQFVADSMSGIPPDNYCAVGKNNKAVAVMNSFITVHDASAGTFLYRKGLLPYSAAVGLNNPPLSNVNYRFDPKVIYDPDADRFISVMLNSTNDYNWIVLGFTQTNDPVGAWNFYKFYGDYKNDTTWFDYPAISITKDEFFLTGNKIHYSTSWQDGFTETLIYQFRKADGYAGDTMTYRIWDNVEFAGKKIRCLHPLKPGDAIAGPEQFFLSNRNFDVSNDTVFLVRVPDTIGAADTNLYVTPIVADVAYGVPPNGRQPDTSKILATNDGRILGGFARGDAAQFVSVTADPVTGGSAIYHGIISNIHSTPSIHGQLFGIDTLDLGYPNISYTGNSGGTDEAIISFEYSGRNTYPGLGAIFSNGTDYSDMTNIISGTGSIMLLTDSTQRWGDYSGSQPDWSAMGTVWVDGIFGRSDHRYGNYMARLASPYYTATHDVTQPATSARVYPNPAVTYVRFEFSVSKAQYFSFVLYDLAGSRVDEVTASWCREGKNIIQFDVTPLAPGTYFLQAIGDKGEQFPVHKVIRK